MSFYRTLVIPFAMIALSSSTLASSPDLSEKQNTINFHTIPAGIVERININAATAKQLMRINGMNAYKARAIVSYRKKHGSFKTIEELKNVPGFKKMDTNIFRQMEVHFSTT